MPVVFHRLEGKCVEGERGGERGNGWSKEDEDKALPTRRNSRGLVFVQVLQLSLSGSLSCAALSGGKTKKKKREKEAQSSQYGQL